MRIHSSWLTVLVFILVGLTKYKVIAVNGSSVSVDLSHPKQPNSNFIQNDEFVSNVSSLEDGEDNFRLIPYLRGTHLNPIDCLSVATDAALQLALGDYGGIMTEPAFYNSDGHLNVEIEIRPYGDDLRTVMPWRFAVWALNESITWMIKRNVQLQASTFIIQYRGEDVGAVLYRSAARPVSNAPLVDESTGQPLPKFENSSESLSASSGDMSLSIGSSRGSPALMRRPSPVNVTDSVKPHPDLDLRFQFADRSVGIIEVFYAVLEQLRDLSPFTTTTRLRSASHYILWSRLYLVLRDPNTPPRTARHPPYLQAEWVMRALAQLPAYMVEEWIFREVEVDIYVDDLRIGVMSIGRTVSSPDTAVSSYI